MRVPPNKVHSTVEICSAALFGCSNMGQIFFGFALDASWALMRSKHGLMNINATKEIVFRRSFPDPIRPYQTFLFVGSHTYCK
jgi:hypothetical protein